MRIFVCKWKQDEAMWDVVEPAEKERVLMAILDAAANNQGYAQVTGVGMRRLESNDGETHIAYYI